MCSVIVAIASAQRPASTSDSTRSSVAAACISSRRVASPIAQSSVANSSSAGPPEIASAARERRQPGVGRGGGQPAHVGQRLGEAVGVDRCDELVAARVDSSAPGPSTRRSRVTLVRRPLGERSSTAASRSARTACGACTARTPSSRRWLALASSTARPVEATTWIGPSTLTTLGPPSSTIAIHRSASIVAAPPRPSRRPRREYDALNRGWGSTRAARRSAPATGSPATLQSGTARGW